MEEMMADLKAVVNSQLRAEEKVLWVRIYLLVQYKAFTGSQIDVADLLGMKRYTFKKQIYTLKDKGALTIKRKYNSKDSVGCAGATYQLMPTEFWAQVQSD
jgi:hypothetical protein